ncbi:BglII/BstYI family type II restriction endonuclease [Seohaeicola nanhaiensis]|uniref:BglII/BstYI family type II restriction endonuclease n=1 Tax=Seohaeicola nanhaiensis TaxID=1387282 RepID=A0ABV9KQE7_9RHOB
MAPDLWGHPSDDDEEDDDAGPISQGKNADHALIIERNFDADLRRRFEFFSYRNAAEILARSFPEQFADLIRALQTMAVTREMIRMPGGSKGPIAKHVDTLFPEDWVETRIAADLHVRLLHAKRTTQNPVLREYSREGYLDGHRIDFVKGRVALDLEWNSKDQTYDRDLYAFSAFYDAGAIDVGVIITRGFRMDTAYFRSLGKVLRKDGSEGGEEVYRKFGASTTWMGKLLYRLDAGRNGGCPVLAIGITPDSVT